TDGVPRVFPQVRTSEPILKRYGSGEVSAGDFKPVTTGIVTEPLSGGGALNDLPLVGQVTGPAHG
ncbi:hypothetical protein ACWCQX_34995, partial [Streptomyces sp. NPDC002346]